MHTKPALAEQATPVALAPADVSMSVSAVSFGDLDLDANDVALAVAWTPPDDGTAGIETYKMYFATDAAGSGRAPFGSVGVGTNAYAVSGVSSDTDYTGKSHVVVYTKSTLAEQTTPAFLQLTDVALVLTVVSKCVSVVSFVDLDFDVNDVGSAMSWAPPNDGAYRRLRAAVALSLLFPSFSAIAQTPDRRHPTCR